MLCGMMRNGLVYDCYGLTEEEIKVVERNGRGIVNERRI